MGDVNVWTKSYFKSTLSETNDSLNYRKTRKVFIKNKALLQVTATRTCYFVTTTKNDWIHSDQSPLANIKKNLPRLKT